MQKNVGDPVHTLWLEGRRENEGLNSFNREIASPTFRLLLRQTPDSIANNLCSKSVTLMK